ncbi:hypothetical protein SSX86_004818 [Deinandra increscens subsp. villosa]|uniref:PHD-type zinc finger plants domain-containing protein n=1 Tax=Deinandra increscens subsp. villosa TaxID=3103831 RepID=A0AAP0H7X5_9ASTR
MVDVERVCCMCGDVGFPDKIFRCINCHHRFQHSYCSSYGIESSEPPEICDWCQTEMVKKASGSSKNKSKLGDAGGGNHRSEYSGNYKIKQEGGSSEKGNNKSSSPSGAPSPKTGTRRYKLLKDVMC